MKRFHVRRGERADLDKVLALLSDVGLPTADLHSSQQLKTWVLEASGSIVGVIALERFGADALLRSLAITPQYRKRGLARELVAHLEDEARRDGVQRLVLLTETAESLFRSLGYEVIDRSSATEELQQSAEFRSLCPASAVCMSKAVLDRVYNVLFLCTGNSARSILAASLINHRGRGQFRGFSAGSHPKGAVHPLALELLNSMQLPTEGLRSKSWDELAAPGAPPLDFVFTVCDNAAGEVCPYWPGQPITAHWGLPDPAAIEGSDSEKRKAFRDALEALETRINLLTSLPVSSLDRVTLKARLIAIGETPLPARAQ
jgi:N-acetylglutamate synthase-like GNAT family acetyltransferase/protein-tyrosine-phosphatase